MILPFPIAARPAAPICAIPTLLTPAWCAQHLPLIDAAMELLEADDAEFARRCQLMADEDGRSMLAELAGQLTRLGGYVADVGDALSLTAERIRDAIAQQPGQSA